VTPLQLIAAGGMLVGAGLVLGVWAVRPAPPQLSAALAQLSTQPSSRALVSVAADRPSGWLPLPLMRLAGRYLGVSDADLEITGWTRPQLAARKVFLALAGLLMPAVLTAALAITGSTPPLVFPAAFSLIIGGGLWAAPSQEIKTKAARARTEFRAALRVFLTLVGLERQARGSPTEALEEASREWRSWPFRLMHAEILRAELAGQQPWDGLRQLGDRLEVQELRNLADIVSTAADGAAIFDTLLAESRSLQHRYLTDEEAAANAASERLVQPVALLAISFMMLVLAPAVLRLFHS